MGIFNGIIAIAISIFLIWMLMRFYKSQPEAFTLKAFNKSLTTMGVLALILIVVIGIVIKLL